MNSNPAVAAAVVGPRWTVVGGGPCGIGAVGRLLDRNCQVTWVDPVFGVGRMGKHYTHVPANTNNRDFIAAFQLNSSFDYVQNEQRRIAQGKAAMSTLRDLECYDLGLYVDTFTDFVDILSRRVTAIRGSVIDLHSSGVGLFNTWQVTVKSCDGAATSVHEADAVILCTGSYPILPPSLIPSPEFGFTGVCQHSLDEMVCPQYCLDLFNVRDAGSDLKVLSRDVPWAVIGSSHSAMLVVKNLCEAGVRNIVNFYRSELRFMHAAPNGTMIYPGIGLKGPVGAWVESNLMCPDNDHPIVKRVQSQEGMSWDQQMKIHNVGHVVAAVGFRRDEGSLPVVRVSDRCLTTSDLDGFDRRTGRIPTGSALDPYIGGPALFGGGIAFPQDIVDGAGHVQPWVGLKRSIELTDVMVDEYCNALARSVTAAATIPSQCCMYPSSRLS